MNNKNSTTLLEKKKSFLNSINTMLKDRTAVKLPSISGSRPASR